MHYAPIARIILRYLIGGVFIGSAEVGEQLAMDPDLVEMLAVGLGFVVEGLYVMAQRKGWAK